MDLSEKIINFEKTDNRDLEICGNTLHIQYGEVKMGSAKSGFSAPSLS